MTRLILTIALAASLAVPAVASAGIRESFREATLQSAAGELTVSQSRCPPGVVPGSSDCGKTKLTERFATGPSPRTRSAAGPRGFPIGVRIAGEGSGECSAESPATVITGPDGSVQFLSGASRVDPGTFAATRIAAAIGRRGVRIAWLEPLAPAIECTYFDEPGTGLALPAPQAPSGDLVSPVISPRVLRRAKFSVVIAGSRDWTERAADGTQVAGHASWRLRLAYKN